MIPVAPDRRDDELVLTASDWQRPQPYGPLYAVISANVQAHPFTMRLETFDDVNQVGRERLIEDAKHQLREMLLNLRDELNELLPVEP